MSTACTHQLYGTANACTFNGLKGNRLFKALKKIIICENDY